MDINFEEKQENRTASKKALEKVKAYEKQANLTIQRINKNTIIMCKNKERIELYKEYITKPISICK